MDGAIEIREVSLPDETDRVFPVIKELRPLLTRAKFLEIYEYARHRDEYAILGAFEKGVAEAARGVQGPRETPEECVGLVGYRVLWDYTHGKHLYVDELVVTERMRSQGIGARLLAHVEALAGDLDCQGLRLCAAVTNTRARSFYEAEGWLAKSFAFKKSLG